jgi:hypothetical protein
MFVEELKTSKEMKELTATAQPLQNKLPGDDYSQNFLKHVLTKDLEMVRNKFQENFVLGFSEELFKTVLLENIMQMKIS